MNVKLIALTKPVFGVAGVDNIESTGDLIAYCARVSNPDNQHNTETAPRLLQYLARNKHWSPFEMAHAVLEITTTRDIARQILRHRSFAFQEFSGRYAAMPEISVCREARMQDETNRQNSLPCDDQGLASWWELVQRQTAAAIRNAYNLALNNGIAKEVARTILPEGMTESRLYMAGSLRSWLHYIEVRTDPSTQKEHREVAKACARVFAEVIPELADFFNHEGE